ncbi:MAG: hypothetical protein RIF41_27290 [Polyangiaceae bacterium]
MKLMAGQRGGAMALAFGAAWLMGTSGARADEPFVGGMGKGYVGGLALDV